MMYPVRYVGGPWDGEVKEIAGNIKGAIVDRHANSYRYYYRLSDDWETMNLVWVGKQEHFREWFKDYERSKGNPSHRRKAPEEFWQGYLGEG